MVKLKVANLARWYIALSLLLGAFGSSSATSNVSAAILQPLLIQMAAKSPEQTVVVIVQKADRSDAAEKLAVRLGGTISKDLHIINAFAVEMTAGAAQELSTSLAVRWISLDAPVKESVCTQCISTEELESDYVRVVRADKVWNESPYLQGQGVTVAVVDSGIKSTHPDLAGRISAQMNVTRTLSTDDFFGHGTYVAGIIAGNGTASEGEYIGIAPKANLVNVKVSNVFGSARESDVIAGLQWIYENRDTYKIRVVNLSINSSTAQSYHTSPLAAACEILWFNGVVVVVSSGNLGEGALYPPANDPFVITVGATDSNETATLEDDQVAIFSAFGVTSDGFSKPDLVAPGRHLIALNASKYTNFSMAHPSNVINKSYFLMSGTSASAPVVSGAVALLLQDEPNLTPDQVKRRLMATANKQWKKYDPVKAGAGILDIKAAIYGTTTKSANTGINVSNLLTTGPQSILKATNSWSSVSWNSVSWNSVSWNSVSWNNVSWNSVAWNSDYWETTSTITDVKTSRALAVNFGIDSEEQQDEESNVTKIFLPLVSSNTD